MGFQSKQLTWGSQTNTDLKSKLLESLNKHVMVFKFKRRRPLLSRSRTDEKVELKEKKKSQKSIL